MKADWMTTLRIQFGSAFVEGVPLAPLTRLKVGGPARGLLTVRDTDGLRDVLGVLRKFQVSFLVLGKGANLIIPDEGYEGLVIRLKGKFETIRLIGKKKNATYLHAGAGVSLPRLVARTAKRGLSGLEPLAGIPGTVGGAIVMNAGVPGFSIADALSSVTTLNAALTLRKRARRQLHPVYRHMGLDAGEIVLYATFRLTPEPEERIRGRIREYLARRKNQTWRRLPTAGSIFKNPEGMFAGRLIEACGLKGSRVGDAQISTEHANVIVNLGKASAKDVLELIGRVRREVAEKTGVTLETEVIIARN